LPAADERPLLDTVCQSVAALVGNSPGPLRRVRAQAGDIIVEMEWSDTTLGAADAGRGGAVATMPAEAGTPVSALPAKSQHYIRAPMVGVFYWAPRPGADPFVRTGEPVVPGQPVAIVEAMKLMNTIEADQAGTVVEVLVADGQSVEFDQPLIALDAAPVEPDPARFQSAPDAFASAKGG
jgi:acetyl-CoA carboxylase biotin carboxyl carrier protein